MNKKPIIFLCILLLLVIAALVAWLTYNKPHQSVDNADFSMEAVQLVAAFEQDEAAANEKYLDKVIEVKGIVKEVLKSDNAVTVLLGDSDAMSGVSCSLSSKNAEEAGDISEGSVVTIKGICSGMLLDVALTNCEIVN